jgi:hypothetical protein
MIIIIYLFIYLLLSKQVNIYKVINIFADSIKTFNLFVHIYTISSKLELYLLLIKSKLKFILIFRSYIFCN